MAVLARGVFLDLMLLELKKLLSWSIKYFPVIRQVIKKLHRCLGGSS